jgi:predicted HTH domain antitoxin
MGKIVQIEIPEEVITGIKIPEKDLEKMIKIKLAIALYQRGYLSLG